MNEIILTDLPTETLAEMAAEKAALVEQHGRKTVQAAIDCGRYLTEIKSRLGHGEWLPWLEENWKHSDKWATQFMRLANQNCSSNLAEASSINEALRMIGEAEEAAGTKRTRKPAESAPEVIDNRPESRTIAQPKPTPDVEKHEQSEPQPVNQSRGIAHDLPPEEPAPLPRTNTHHTAANRRTPDARETDRVGIVCPDDPRELQDGRLYRWSESANRLFLATPEELWAAAMELRPDEIRGNDL